MTATSDSGLAEFWLQALRPRIHPFWEIGPSLTYTQTDSLKQPFRCLDRWLKWNCWSIFDASSSLRRPTPTQTIWGSGLLFALTMANDTSQWKKALSHSGSHCWEWPRPEVKFLHKQGHLSPLYFFLASQDAIEVMYVSEYLSDRSHWLDWCDPGEWWYL